MSVSDRVEATPRRPPQQNASRRAQAALTFAAANEGLAPELSLTEYR